jgi:hypothetical protein
MKKGISKNELSNIDIALFALYKLGGITKKVHTEDIAWEAYQLAKERFSWRLIKYKEMGFPDKTPVRFALEQAKKKESGALVTGRAGGDINRPELEGWRFTPDGVDWIKKNESRISKLLKHAVPDLPKLVADRFARKLRTDACFQYFVKNGDLNDVSSFMFADMLECAPDASKDIIKQKFESILSTANLINDSKINKFMNACKIKFKHLLRH